MRALLNVCRKEFLENLRDRRTLISALLFGPLFGPLLFGAMVSRMLHQTVLESEEPLQITIAGGERAPNLERYLESQGVKLGTAPLSESTARAAVRDGSAAVVLIVPPDYAERFAAALPAPLLLVADSSDSQNRTSADRVRRLLANYSGGLAQQRLQVRGVSPLLALPIAVNEVDVDWAAASAAALSILLPPEAWTVSMLTCSSAAWRTAAATVLGMSWNFKSRKTLRPEATRSRTICGPSAVNNCLPIL